MRKAIGITAMVVIMAIVATLVLARHAPTTDILIGDASGVAGQTGVGVDVVVNTQGQVVRGVNINLAFNGVVLPNAVAVPGPGVPAGWTFVENLAGPGDHRVIVTDFSGEGQALSGVLYTVEFDIAAGAPLGDVGITTSLVDIPDGGAINVVPGVVSVVGEVISNGVVGMGLAALIVSLDVEPRTVKGPAGTIQQLAATARLTNGAVVDVTSLVTWTSSDLLVATVNTAGLVTIVGPGNVVITATISPFP